MFQLMYFELTLKQLKIKMIWNFCLKTKLLMSQKTNSKPLCLFVIVCYRAKTNKQLIHVCLFVCFQTKLMSPHSETDTLLSWPQSTGGRATSSLSGSRPRRRDEFARRDELGRRERDRDRDRDEFVVPRRAGSTLGTGSRRAPPYDLTFRPNSAFLYHPPPLRWNLILLPK
jgi:hypothetical protein